MSAKFNFPHYLIKGNEIPITLLPENLYSIDQGLHRLSKIQILPSQQEDQLWLVAHWDNLHILETQISNLISKFNFFLKTSLIPCNCGNNNNLENNLNNKEEKDKINLKQLPPCPLSKHTLEFAKQKEEFSLWLKEIQKGPNRFINSKLENETSDENVNEIEQEIQQLRQMLSKKSWPTNKPILKQDFQSIMKNFENYSTYIPPVLLQPPKFLEKCYFLPFSFDFPEKNSNNQIPQFAALSFNNFPFENIPQILLKKNGWKVNFGNVQSSKCSENERQKIKSFHSKIFLKVFPLSEFGLLKDKQKEILEKDENPGFFLTLLNAPQNSIDYEMMENFFEKETLENGNIIETNYRNIKYQITSITSDVLPTSKFLFKEKEVQFIDYYSQNYKLEIKDKKTPLFKAIPIGNPRLKSYLYNQKEIKRTSKSKNSQEINLIPEFCKFQFSNILIFSILKKIPSIFYKIEWYSKFCGISSFLSFWTLKHSLEDIEKVFTASKAQQLFDYERFETLGDSVFKFITSQCLFFNSSLKNSGQLSIEREKLISNEYLFKKGKEFNLEKFINTTPFSNDSWNPAGFFPKKSRQFSQKFKNKIIADVIEALIGFEFQKNGENSVLEIIENLNLIPNFSKKEFEKKEIEKKEIELKEEYQNTIHTLEKTLNYNFKDKRLLLESITNQNILNEIENENEKNENEKNENEKNENEKNEKNFLKFDRFSFLGDAVIEMIIVEYIFEMFPFLEPSGIHDLKSLALSNEFLARITIQHNLHQNFFHKKPQIGKKFSEIKQNSIWLQELPKELGDLFESLLGAIFLDTHLNFKKTKNIIFPLISDSLNRFITPTNISKNPIRLFSEKFSSFITSLTSCPKIEDKGYPTIFEINGIQILVTFGNSIRTSKWLAASQGIKNFNFELFEKIKVLIPFFQGLFKKKMKLEDWISNESLFKKDFQEVFQNIKWERSLLDSAVEKRKILILQEEEKICNPSLDPKYYPDFKECPFFKKGSCKFGKKCLNLHINEEGILLYPPSQNFKKNEQIEQVKNLSVIPDIIPKFDSSLNKNPYANPWSKEDFFPLTPDGGIYKKILKSGFGYPTEPKTKIFCTFFGILYENGKIIDESYTDEWFSWTLGDGTVLEMWEILGNSLKSGEICRVRALPEYAYGRLGCPPRIPPNAILEYEVQVHLLERKNDKKPMLSLKERMDESLKDKIEGTTQVKRKAWRKASKSYNRALHIFRGYTTQTEEEDEIILETEFPLYLNLSFCYLNLKEYSKAIKMALNAINIKSNSAKAFYRLAQAYAGSTFYLEEAKEAILKSLKLEPNNNEIKQEVKRISTLLLEYEKKNIKESVFTGMFNNPNNFKIEDFEKEELLKQLNEEKFTENEEEEQ